MTEEWKRYQKKINTRQLGSYYESMAAEYLKQQGYEIIERNFSCRLGEIDLIAREGDSIIFVEVKYRSRNDCGYPSEAVNQKKQRRISNAASYYIWKKYGNRPVSCRFDVVSIQKEKITLYRDAYAYCGNFF